MKLSAASVIERATDDASVKAAKGLTSPSKWGASLGFTDRATWGACQGSGSKPYQTQVDLSGASPSFKCSCPSRKFPCKHGLALMLLRADNEGLFKTHDEPSWVSEWIDSRKEKAQKKQEQVELLASDPVAAATAAAGSTKREQGRWRRIETGAHDLERFLCDQIDRGLAGLGREQADAWLKMAARMVDAQAPAWGLALQRAAANINQGPDWPTQVLQAMGQLQLNVDAVRHRDALPDGLRHDLQASLGWALDKDLALRQGERVADDWWVVGSVVEERENNLTERRVWLVGAQTGRRALILDHSHGGRGFEVFWPLGRCVRTVLAYFPSAWPQRAVVAKEMTVVEAEPWTARAPALEWEAAAEQLAHNPFSVLSLMLFTNVTPTREAAQGKDRWWLRADGADASAGSEASAPGSAIPLRIGKDQGWDLLANAAGLPLKLAGEWNGTTLRPTTALSAEGLLAFEGHIDERSAR